MRRLLVIGAGGHARPVISSALNSRMWEVVGVIDINYSGQEEFILGVPVIGSIEKIKEFNARDVKLFIAVGDNKKREALFDSLILNRFEYANIIHPKAHLDPTVVLGTANFIAAFSHIGPNVRLGNGNIINTYANLEHEVVLENFGQVAPAAIVCGRCNIGNRVFLGANATIIDGLTIAEDTTVGAGAVITKNITIAGQTFVGIPGKPL
ncbi:MAG: acetyltransferase [Pseudohongiella sp.]|nr:acetyltransferase [Pseudohongiella sp.]